MAWRHTIEMTLSDFYNLSSLVLSVLIFIVALIFLFCRLKLNIKLLKRITKFSEKHQKK